MDVQGTYRADFEYGFEIDHQSQFKTGSAKIVLNDGIVEGHGSELSIEGIYEIKSGESIYMDVIAKPPLWDPIKKGERMFFLRGKIVADSLELIGPIGDDPRLFIRAKLTRE